MSKKLILKFCLQQVFLAFNHVGKPNNYANYMHIIYANYMQISRYAIKNSWGEH